MSFDHFESLNSLGFITQLASYDLVLVDFQMEHINGIEIAAYAPSFFALKPFILVSSTPLEKMLSKPLPSYVAHFIHKNRSPKAIIEEALACYCDYHKKQTVA